MKALISLLLALLLASHAEARQVRVTYRRACGFLIVNVTPGGSAPAQPYVYQTPAPPDPRLDTIIAQNIQIMALLAAKNNTPPAPQPIYVPPGAALPPGYTPAPTPPGTVPPGFTPGAPLPQGYVPAPLPQAYTPAPLPGGYTPNPLPGGYSPSPLPGGYNPSPSPVIINVPGGAAPSAPQPALPPGYTPSPGAPTPAPLPGGYNPAPIGASASAPAPTPQRYTRALSR